MCVYVCMCVWVCVYVCMVFFSIGIRFSEVKVCLSIKKLCFFFFLFIYTFFPLQYIHTYIHIHIRTYIYTQNLPLSFFHSLPSIISFFFISPPYLSSFLLSSHSLHPHVSSLTLAFLSSLPPSLPSSLLSLLLSPSTPPFIQSSPANPSTCFHVYPSLPSPPSFPLPSFPSFPPSLFLSQLRDILRVKVWVSSFGVRGWQLLAGHDPEERGKGGKREGKEEGGERKVRRRRFVVKD